MHRFVFLMEHRAANKSIPLWLFRCSLGPNGLTFQTWSLKNVSLREWDRSIPFEWKCSESLPKHRRHCVASRLCNNMDSFLLLFAWKHLNPFGCRLTGIEQNVEPISGSYLRGVDLFATCAPFGLL